MSFFTPAYLLFYLRYLSDIYKQIIFLALLHHNTTKFHFVVVRKCHNGTANRDILSVHLPCQVVNINAYRIKLRCKLSPIYFIL